MGREKVGHEKTTIGRKTIAYQGKTNDFVSYRSFFVYNLNYARHQSNPINSTFFSFVLGIAMINCFLTVVANLPASTIAVAVMSKPGLYT